MGVAYLNSARSPSGALTDVEETCISCTGLASFSRSSTQKDDHRFALKQAHQMWRFLTLSDTHLQKRSHSSAGDYTLRIMHSPQTNYLKQTKNIFAHKYGSGWICVFRLLIIVFSQFPFLPALTFGSHMIKCHMQECSFFNANNTN